MLTNSKKILFRGDAKLSIGTGDIVSLIELSKYFLINDWICFFMVKDNSIAVDLLKSRGINNYVVIKEDGSIQEEVNEINLFINEHAVDVLIMQQFEIDYELYSGITGGCYNVAIANNGKIPNNFAMVISWDVKSIGLINKHKKNNTKYLLDDKYVILPAYFNDFKLVVREYKSKPNDILITMGGCDESNMTLDVVKFISYYKLDYRLNIVLGKGYQYIDVLLSYLKGVKLNYIVKSNVLNMYNEMIDCDFAITAGGVTVYELLATRTPAISIATVPHQIDRCMYYDECGLIRFSGYQKLQKTVFDDFISDYESIAIELSKGPDFDTESIVREIEKEVIGEIV